MTGDRNARFSFEELKARAFRRIAYVLHDWYEEGGRGRGDTRVFETLIKDEYVLCGTSVNGGTCREHVVPCGDLMFFAYALFEDGHTIPEVAQFIGSHLKIALLTQEETDSLNKGWRKDHMPKGWKPGGDVMARLAEVGIVLNQSYKKT